MGILHTVRRSVQVPLHTARHVPVAVAAVALLAGAAAAQTQPNQSATSRPTVSRPMADAGPTQVFVRIWIADIDRIDSANQNYAANVFVGLRWQDPRLAHGGEGARAYEPASIWNPRILVVNETGLVRKTLPETAEVSPDGTVVVRQRYVGSFSQVLNLEHFPLDEHVISFQLASPGYTEADIAFVPDNLMPTASGPRFAAGGGIAAGISLPDWDILWTTAEAVPYVTMPGSYVAGYALEFKARRRMGYFIWKLLLPLLLIILMSWSVFWIDPSNSGTQIAVATTSMLTLIAYRFAVDQNIPKVDYMTRMDYFVIGSSVLVFITLCQVVVTAHLGNSNRLPLARKLDAWSRLVFVVLLVGLAVGSFVI